VGAKPDVWPRPSWAWGALTDSAGQKLAMSISRMNPVADDKAGTVFTPPD
jgi:hypothetical protein